MMRRISAINKPFVLGRFTRVILNQINEVAVYSTSNLFYKHPLFQRSNWWTGGKVEWEEGFLRRLIPNLNRKRESYSVSILAFDNGANKITIKFLSIN